MKVILTVQSSSTRRSQIMDVHRDAAETMKLSHINI